MWPLGLPVAVEPLWQVAQVPGAMPVWLKRRRRPGRGLVARVARRCGRDMVAGLPFAVEPLWQVAQVPGATPVWLKVAGIQAVVLWQVSHAAVVGMWLLGLPVAVEPLWQVAQVPGATPVWLKVAGIQAVVLWQLSHDSRGRDVVARLAGRGRAVVAGRAGARCHTGVAEGRRHPGSGLVAGVAGSGGRDVVAGLPVAVEPLWQVAQVPGATPVWLKVAGSPGGGLVAGVAGRAWSGCARGLPLAEVAVVAGRAGARRHAGVAERRGQSRPWSGGRCRRRVVGMCAAACRCGRGPLWQVAQVPGATPVWLKVAGVQALVLWQRVAGRGGRDVTRRLALGRGPVVAGRAGARRHTAVAEGRRRPGRGLVAGVAGRGGRDVLAACPWPRSPLWQVAQVPGATPVWLNVAGVQAVVWWQVSHAAVVGTWLDGLPLAGSPLWQVAQVPGATPVWLKVAGHPGAGLVAGVARGRGRDVRRRLALGRGPVVAGRTGARRHTAVAEGRRASRRWSCGSVSQAAVVGM